MDRRMTMQHCGLIRSPSEGRHPQHTEEQYMKTDGPRWPRKHGNPEVAGENRKRYAPHRATRSRSLGSRTRRRRPGRGRRDQCSHQRPARGRRRARRFPHLPDSLRSRAEAQPRLSARATTPPQKRASNVGNMPAPGSPERPGRNDCALQPVPDRDCEQEDADDGVTPQKLARQLHSRPPLNHG